MSIKSKRLGLVQFGLVTLLALMPLTAMFLPAFLVVYPSNG